jgi:site-specific recombinase XerC
MKIGLRTGEIASLRVENIDFETRSFQVLDSKKRILFPLPLDILTLQLIKDLSRHRTHGYVFRQKTSWKYTKAEKPLTDQTIWHTIHKIGREAGVPNFNPRMLRHYFAANWARDLKKSVPGLQDILRHESLESTQVYIGRLSFWEDMQQEYDQIKSGPFIEFQGEEAATVQVQRPRAKVCNDCAALDVCKFVASMPECTTGCSYRVSSQVIRLAEPLKQRK